MGIKKINISNYGRLQTTPERTFFLFGPRGTGKTSWLKSHLTSAHTLWIDLLNPSILMQYQRDPQLMASALNADAQIKTVVIDEVQRLPSLLDVVQMVLTQRKDITFALTGSSARKLKSDGANLLGGRALTRNLYPLNCIELGNDFNLEQAIKYGTLPEIVNASSDEERVDLLDSYVLTYLTLEIQQEALVRRLEVFQRFLSVAALLDGQISNLSNVARDVGVSRSTVQGYFEVLVDTLIGSFLPSFRARAKIKEVAHSKFYLFDPGVARALAGEHRNPLSREDKGQQLENLFYGQLKALDHYLKIGGQFSYWRTNGGTEVDLIWARGKHAIGIELKSGTQWRPEYGRGLEALLHAKSISKGYGVYLGTEIIKHKSITIYPFLEFLKAVHKGHIAPV